MKGYEMSKSAWFLFMGLAVVMMAAGCATNSGGSGAQAEIGAVLNEWKAAFEKSDLDAIVAPISDDFEHYEWNDKEGMKDFLGGAKLQGELDGAEVDLQYAEYEKNDDGSWTVYPVDITAAFGGASLELLFKKEDGAWKIVKLDVSGV